MTAPPEPARSFPEGLYLWAADKPHGPLDLEALQELHRQGSLSLESLLSASPAGPWVRLADHPAALAIAPPVVPPLFREREFVRANPLGGSPIDHHDLIRAANRPFAFAEPHGGATPRPPNDVQTLVAATARATAAVEPPMQFVRRKDPRRRDYFILLGLGYAFGAVLLVHFRAQPTPLGAVALFLVFYTALLTWFMFWLIDRY